jgi:hypothetical protein
MKRSGTWRVRARADVQLPLQRYFLFAGGALLVLIFAAGWVAPPPKGEHVKSEVRLPVIRIHSERKGPEAVVFDTTQPTFLARVEQDGAATRQAVASTDSSAIDKGSQLSGSTPEPAEPPKLSGPRIQHHEMSDHAHLRRRPPHHDPVLSVPSNTMFAATEGRMREAFAQAPTLPRIPLPLSAHYIRPATQD